MAMAACLLDDNKTVDTYFSECGDHEDGDRIGAPQTNYNPWLYNPWLEPWSTFCPGDILPLGSPGAVSYTHLRAHETLS